MTKPTKEFGYGWKHGLGMCAFLFRLTSVLETRLFRHQRSWNIPRSLSSLPLNCMPIPRRALLVDFHEIPTKLTQCRAFLRKSELKADSSLKEIIEVIREFVMPVVNGLSERKTENKVWQPGGRWGKDRRL